MNSDYLNLMGDAVLVIIAAAVWLFTLYRMKQSHVESLGLRKKIAWLALGSGSVLLIVALIAGVF